MNRLPIDTPLPEDLKPGDPVPWANPVWLDLLTRKVNALSKMRGVGDFVVHHTEDETVIEQKT